MNDVDLAKESANKACDILLRRKLWTLVAKHVLKRARHDKKSRSETFRSLLKLCKEKTSPLRLENVISLLGDFFSADKTMREMICELLRSDDKKRDEIRTSVKSLNDASRRIRDITRDVQNRYACISCDRTCDICNDTVTPRPFYMFLCTHVFHVECLVEIALRSQHHLNQEQKRRLRSVLTRIEALETELKSGHCVGEKEKSIRHQISKERKVIDLIVASQCIFCGTAMIQSTSSPLIFHNEFEYAKSWVI